MENILSVPVNCLSIICDYETAERCGASGTFQVEKLIADTEYGELDITNMVDQGKHYFNLDDAANDLGLNVDINEL